MVQKMWMYKNGQFWAQLQIFSNSCRRHLNLKCCLLHRVLPTLQLSSRLSKMCILCPSNQELEIASPPPLARIWPSLVCLHRLPVMPTVSFNLSPVIFIAFLREGKALLPTSSKFESQSFVIILHLLLQNYCSSTLRFFLFPLFSRTRFLPCFSSPLSP